MAVVGGVCLGMRAGRCWAADEIQAHVTSSTSPVRLGSWMVMKGNVVNHSDHAVSGALVVKDELTGDVQFEAPPARVPGACEGAQFPLLFVLTTLRNKFDVGLNVTLVEGAGGRGESDRVLAKDLQKVPFSDGTEFPTAICQMSGQDGPANVMMRLRVVDRRKARLSYFDQMKNPSPSSVLGLLCFSEMLMASSDRMTPSQALAVREWLVQGGRLWIMADRVPAETIRMILGDEWKCEVAGETELTRVAIEGAARRGGAAPQATLYASPIRMVRLVNDGMEVTHTIEKWPAILWRPVGAGTLLVTTFDMAAMGAGDEKADFGWFPDINERFLAPSKALTPAAVTGEGSRPAMHELASTIAGHDVVRREPVAIILGGLCLLLLAFGWHFGRKYAGWKCRYRRRRQRR